MPFITLPAASSSVPHVAHTQLWTNPGFVCSKIIFFFLKLEHKGKSPELRNALSSTGNVLVMVSVAGISADQ